MVGPLASFKTLYGHCILGPSHPQGDRQVSYNLHLVNGETEAGSLTCPGFFSFSPHHSTPLYSGLGGNHEELLKVEAFGKCVPPGTQATSIGSWVKFRSQPNCSPSETFGKRPCLHSGQDITG